MSVAKAKAAASSTIIEDAASGVVSFLKSVRKHWPLVITTLVLSIAGAIVYTKTQKPVYQAVSMMEFDPNVVRPLGGDKQDSMAAFMSYWDNREYYETQYRIITSDAVLTRVVRDLGLMNDAPEPKPGKAAPSVEDYAAGLRGQITVEPIKNSRLINVKVNDTDPARARRICDAVVHTYLLQNLEKSVQGTADAAVWLSSQVDHYKGELEGNENALHAFKKENELPSTSLNEASNMLRVEMQTFNEGLSKTRSRKEEISARYAELSRISPDNPSEVPSSELLSNAFLSTLRGEYQRAIKEKQGLIAQNKGPNHELVKAADDRIDETKRDLVKEIKNIQGAVGRDLAVIQRQEAGDKALYEGSRKKAVELNMKEIEYRRLDRAREQNEKIYGMLLARMKEADLARMMNVNNVRQVDPPVEPKVPVKPSLPTNLGVGIALGLLLGLAFAWMREQLDSSIKTPDDVENKLGVTFLGLLPTFEGDREEKKAKKSRRLASKTVDTPELIVHERPLSGIAEAARTIRTNLLFMNPDKPYKKLLISSAAPAEGKTTVACSIAIALAQGGQRVCIIDCDLRRPRLHRIFGRAGDMGVTNVIVGDATIDQVAKPTVVDNLWSIPAGPVPPNPADLLHSERFQKFLKELGEKFDRVIIDSPPLVAVTDAAIISTLVDGTVFVMRAFKTSKQLGRQGLRALLDVDTPVAGAVLNAVNLNRHEYNYYHYYYYKREGYGPLPGNADAKLAATNEDHDHDEPAAPAPPN